MHGSIIIGHAVTDGIGGEFFGMDDNTVLADFIAFLAGCGIVLHNFGFTIMETINHNVYKSGSVEGNHDLQKFRVAAADILRSAGAAAGHDGLCQRQIKMLQILAVRFCLDNTITVGVSSDS